MLEERNRLKKAVEAKSDRTLKRDELERGFNLHFHGSPRGGAGAAAAGIWRTPQHRRRRVVAAASGFPRWQGWAPAGFGSME